MKIGEKLVIQILGIDRSFYGGMTFGMTSVDPSGLNQVDLPDDSDLLLDRPEYWVVNKDICNIPELGDEISIYLNEEGECFVPYHFNIGLCRDVPMMGGCARRSPKKKHNSLMYLIHLKMQ
jgi:hypothetical protein